jgi:DNA topoisomerase-1
VFLVEEKEEIARNRIIKDFEGSDIQVLNGRYGPYISDGKLNGRIPKDREPSSLTLEEVVQLMEETGKPMRGRFGKKAAAKKAPAKKAAAKKAPGEKKPAVKKAAGKTGAKKAAKKTAKKAATKKPAARKAAFAPKAPAKHTAPVAAPEPPPMLTPKPFTGGKRVVKKAG